MILTFFTYNLSHTSHSLFAPHTHKTQPIIQYNSSQLTLISSLTSHSNTHTHTHTHTHWQHVTILDTQSSAHTQVTTLFTTYNSSPTPTSYSFLTLRTAHNLLYFSQNSLSTHHTLLAQPTHTQLTTLDNFINIFDYGTESIRL